MSQKIRQEQILQILKSKGYVPVSYLVDMLQYSTATINRDLNAMQTLKLVKRSHGGVEIYNHPINFLPPLPIREFYHKPEKRKIAKEACELISDGDTIFLSGTTTVLYMIPFLSEKKDITVITNSVRICLELGETDLRVICLGGEISERPHVVRSDLTIENAMRFHVDKMFFSTNAITKDGLINHSLLYHTVMKNSKEVYLLTDKTKFVDRLKQSLCDFSALTGVISNVDFSKEVKESYPNVEFILAK